MFAPYAPLDDDDGYDSIDEFCLRSDGEFCLAIKFLLPIASKRFVDEEAEKLRRLCAGGASLIHTIFAYNDTATLRQELRKAGVYPGLTAALCEWHHDVVAVETTSNIGMDGLFRCLLKTEVCDAHANHT